MPADTETTDGSVELQVIGADLRMPETSVTRAMRGLEVASGTVSTWAESTTTSLVSAGGLVESTGDSLPLHEAATNVAARTADRRTLLRMGVLLPQKTVRRLDWPGAFLRAVASGLCVPAFRLVCRLS